MKSPKQREKSLRVGESYSFTVNRIDRRNGQNYFILLYNGKETRPLWAKRGLLYNTPVLATQENEDLDSYIGKTIKCKVVQLEGNYPILAQCEDDNNIPKALISSIPNFNESTERHRKTILRAGNMGNRSFNRLDNPPRNTVDETTSMTERTSKNGRTEQQAKGSAAAEALYQQGQKAEKSGKTKEALGLYYESAQKGNMQAQRALGKMYLKKALELLGSVHLDIDNLMALILNQETDSDSGTDAVPKVQQNRVTKSSHQPSEKKHQKESENTPLTSTDVLTHQAPVIPDSAEKLERPQYKVWMHTPFADSEASFEVDSILEAATNTEGSGAPLSGWAMEAVEAPEETAKEPIPEPECHQTENSGSELTETEKKDIDLSLSPISPRTGCFFCRLLDKLSTFFSRK